MCKGCSTFSVCSQGLWPTQTCLRLFPEAISPGKRLLGYEAGHSLLRSAKFKKNRSGNPTSMLAVLLSPDNNEERHSSQNKNEHKFCCTNLHWYQQGVNRLHHTLIISYTHHIIHTPYHTHIISYTHHIIHTPYHTLIIPYTHHTIHTSYHTHHIIHTPYHTHIISYTHHIIHTMGPEERGYFGGVLSWSG
jgi:hypothetical protein